MDNCEWNYIIGKLIQYYRNGLYDKTRNPKWNRCNFVKDAKGNNICTRQTLKKAEQGDYVIPKLISICERAISELQPFLNHLYYEEYYRLFVLLYRYYTMQDVLFGKEAYQHYFEIFYFLNKQVQEVLLYLFLVYAFQNSSKEIKCILESFEVEKYHYLPIQVVYLSYRKLEYKYDVIKKYQELELKANQLNSLHLLQIERCLMSTFCVVQPKYSLEYAHKVEKLINEDMRYQLRQRNSTYLALGIVYTRLGVPKKAIEYINRIEKDVTRASYRKILLIPIVCF